MTNSLLLHVRILSPSATLCDTEAQACFIPTPEGSMKVLPRHMPVTGRVSAGTLTVEHENGTSTTHTSTSGGFYRITPNQTHIWLMDSEKTRDKLYSK